MKEEIIDVSLDEVFRSQGADAEQVRQRRPRLYALSEAALAEALTLIQPSLVVRRLAVQRVERDALWLEGDYCLQSSLLARQLAAAQVVSVVIASMGEAIAARATEVMNAGKHAHGYTLDCAGTLALEHLARRFQTTLEAEAAAQGWQVSHRFSPGLNPGRSHAVSRRYSPSWAT